MAHLAILRTERLVLRPLTMDDLAAWVAMDGDPAVMRYIHPVRDRTERRADFIKRIERRFDNHLGYWSVREKAQDERFVGAAMLVPLALKGPDIEIGYRLVRNAWGRGLASEAGRCILCHAFDTARLDTVVAVTHLQNHASKNVLRKIGLLDAGEIFAYDETCALFRLDAVAYAARRR